MSDGFIMVLHPAEYINLMNATLRVGLRYFIGIAELPAVVGLGLPGVLRIYPGLLPLTLVGLIIVSASASVYHTFRAESRSAIYTAVLFTSAFIVCM